MRRLPPLNGGGIADHPIVGDTAPKDAGTVVVRAPKANAS